MFRPSVASRFCSTSASSRSVAEKRRALLDRIVRVDHAGEFGADRIYAGQHAVLSKTSDKKTADLIQHMWDQEKHHLATFERYLPKYRSRPTALLPIWHVAGFALGAGTALLGKEAAMACTVAVESSITEHYDAQIRTLLKEAKDEGDDELHKELVETIQQFRDEEQEHHDIGLEQEAEQAPMYEALTSVIKVGCKGAIWLSERI